MSRFFQAFLSGILLILIAIGVMCTIPTDPTKDPNNLQATIVLLNTNSVITQSEQATFGITINYPVYVDTVTVSFGEENIPDTVLQCSTSTVYPETLLIQCTYNSVKMITVTANIKLTNNSYKIFRKSFEVFPSKPSVSFLPVQYIHLVALNKPVTLNFQALTNPIGNVIDFIIESDPVLSGTTINLTDEGSNAKVAVTCSQLQQQKINCIAKSSSNAYDTAEVLLIPYNSSISTDTINNKKMYTGMTDTFTIIIPSAGDSSIQINLIDTTYSPGVVTVLPMRSDTIQVLFTPNESKTYVFPFRLTIDSLSDTVTFKKTVIGKEHSIWNQTSSTIGVYEKQTLIYPLRIHLADTAMTGITIIPSKGSVSGDTLTLPIPWGSPSNDTITLTAYRSGFSSEFKLLVNITPSDSIAPVIRKLLPDTNFLSVNSDKIICKFIITDNKAGIGSVLFTRDSSIITNTSHTDSLYLCIVDSLKHGIPAILKITAADASMKKNKDSLVITILRDTTKADTEAPVISYISGPQSGSRLTTATGILTVSITDKSGIASATASLNTLPISEITVTGNTFSIPFTLPQFGINRMVITATDNAELKNTDSLVLTFNYNTAISAITPLTPVHNTTNVVLTPQFTWNGGVDTDMDTVFYKVFYGTDSTALKTATPELTSQSTLAPSALAANTTFYWQVIGYSKINADTTRSEIHSFTTTTGEITPQIIVHPTSKKITEGTGSTLSITATGTNLRYQWQKDSVNIDGAVAAQLTVPIVSLANNGDTYRCIVYNILDTLISANAVLTVVKNIIPPSITIQPTNQTSALGKPVTFTVTANGTDLLYQWKKGTDTIDGAQTATYTIPSLTSDLDGTSYQCVISNSAGTVTTTSALLTATYSVTYNGNNNTGGEIPVDQKPYLKDSPVIVAAPQTALSLTGHTFSGWRRTASTGKTYQTGDSLLINAANVTLYAYWVIDTFTISFDTDNGTVISPKKVTYGSRVEMPSNPTKTGHHFAGWFISSEGSTEFDPATTITQSRTIYAHWTPYFTVTYNSNGGTGIVPTDNGEYEGGTYEVLDKPAGLEKTNYTFDGWQTSINGGSARVPGNSYAISSNVTLYAKWLLAKPSISSDLPIAVIKYRGDSYTFNFSANGLNLSYRWQKDGVDITGETGATLALSSLFPTSNNIGIYRCIVSNEGGADTTIGSRLSVYETRPMKNIVAKGIPFSMGQTGVLNATPAHTVTITHNFYMDSTEVTQQQFTTIMDNAFGNFITPDYQSSGSGYGPAVPAYYNTWFDAVLYCNALTKSYGSYDTVYTYTGRTGIPGQETSALTGITIHYDRSGYRLPTEAEWEFACRAGTTHKVFWENSSYPETFANYFETGFPSIYPVTSAFPKPNDFGLYHMIGNVREWCNDWYADYTSSPTIDPTGPSSGTKRVTRGGSVMQPLDNLSSALRTDMDTPDAYTRFVGFRVVLPH